MIVSLSTPTFDLDGHILIDTIPANTEGTTARRVSRVQTLDGGVAINDRGYSEGDRDLTFIWRTQSRAHSDSIDRLVKLYSTLWVCIHDDVYVAAPQSFTPGVTESTLNLLAIEKLT